MRTQSRERRIGIFSALAAALLLGSCGGGTGTKAGSGTEKTTLTVEATDPDGDTLHYNWRVTAGAIDNRDARSTVWTLPAGPGLHFAYVTVTDGKGGVAEQQYAVSSDTLDIAAPVRAPVNRTALAFTGSEGGTGRLSFVRTGYFFANPNGGNDVERYIYMPSVRVELRNAANEVVFAGESDATGRLDLPQLANDAALKVYCAAGRGIALAPCNASRPLDAPVVTPTAISAISSTLQPPTDPAHNLRLYGHLGFADGGVCHHRNEFTGRSLRATAQLQLIDGSALAPAVEVNQFGDYAIDAAVPVQAQLNLRVRCEGIDILLPVRAATGAGYDADTKVELSGVLPNKHPRIVKMVANGPEGSVRGAVVELALAGAPSNSLPGTNRFLAFRGLDTRAGACLYYKSFGAVQDCDAQGNMLNPISLADWRRQHKFGAHATGNVEVAATYVNKMDLNLVRRMVATQSAPDNIAFVVCNHPGPEGRSQREVDQVIDTALADEKLVACVAMEWSVTPGVNGSKPFTKFLTFGPDGGLLLSVNLDGRGEKYMPGTCVACHGGNQYRGRFPQAGNPSPNLGSGFLPFDNGNYLFSSSGALRKDTQQMSIHGLNKLVRETWRDSASNAVRNLVNGWYANDTRSELQESYVPPAWQALDVTRPGAATVYREIVGASCRTCHVAFQGFDWDAEPQRIVVPAGSTQKNVHVCGGSPDLAVNASMPNALISRDRAFERVAEEPALAALMQQFFGCTKALPDPAYTRQ